ncbi:MAG: hypothetical protein LBJ04_22900 [Sphingobacterium sp.]|jgi:hypothetical protein|nr:hypothetical protein [Sphingobacterium sp.]
MTNIKNSTMEIKSLALKNDKHLGVLRDQMELNNDTIVVKQYAYIDYDVVGGGAIFFFVPFEKWKNDDWDEKVDLKEIFIEFEKQVIGNSEFDISKGVLIRENCELIDNSHEAFRLDEALQEAEYKAIEYIIDRG